MRVLKIYLKRVEKVKVENPKTGKLKSKIFNTLSIPVKNDKAIADQHCFHFHNFRINYFVYAQPDFHSCIYFLPGNSCCQRSGEPSVDYYLQF